ncbi:hypothetical protein [Serratia liquefaciens]|uniref:hypothetical protein n=1 Tax=Serratia liquefaciens TaxID=614 RepID=UPI0021BB71CC|nr:hypothetical protein [Serratia liquefaciens]
MSNIMIYHYTDLNAIQSVVENNVFWLTDYRFLNDKEEYVRGYDILLESFSDFVCSYPNDSPELFGCISMALDSIKSGEIREKLESNRFFVGSFSRSPDTLSQWRSYGMFSLGVDDDKLMALSKKQGRYYLECHYIQDDGDALEYAYELIAEKILPLLVDIWNNGEGHWKIDFELSLLIDIYALSFKNSAFYDEGEVRIVVSCEPDDEGIKFRSKGEYLVPYIELSVTPETIQEIMIGPVKNQEVADDSLTMFARKVSNKFKKSGCKEYELVVDKSDIPYRSL